MSLSDLLSRVEAFELDDPQSKLPFSTRLARDNGWSLDFSKRVIREYKRFAYLAASGRGPVTPSDPVDQAWHLHLCYTRSYWDQFCGQVLGQPLHHEPTRGGSNEQSKHLEQYQQTLIAYREAFNEEPPRDIWPPVEECFRSGAKMVRVNRDQVWLVPKIKLPWPTLGVGAVSLLLLGCTPAVVQLPLFGSMALPGPLFLAIFVALYVLIWVAVVKLRRQALVERQGMELPQSFASGPQYLFERAYLVGGAGRVVDTVLMKLSREHRLSFDESTKRFSVLDSNREQGASFDNEVLDLIERDSRLLTARGAIFNRAEALYRSRLEGLGLLADPDKTASVRRLSGWLGFLMLVGGVIQWKESTPGHPVGFLILCLFVQFITWLVFINWRPLRNRKGDQTIALLRLQHGETRHVPSGVNYDAYPVEVGVAIFGMSMLVGTAYEATAKQIAPATSSFSDGGGGGCSTSGCGTGGDGGGGGDGGSGCGGGCGGGGD